MSDLVVLGADPGLRSFAVCVLRNGHIAKVWHHEVPRKERVKGHYDTDRFLQVWEGAVTEMQPNVCGIEDYEPQPWRTQGRSPVGGVEMMRLIRQMKDVSELAGITTFMQSPAIQKDYVDEAVDAFIRKYMGRDYEISSHLRSATKHAMYAESRALYARRIGT